MAFETGVSTSPMDLLDKVRTFAAGVGWSVTTGGAGGDGPLGQVSMESAADGVFIHAISEAASHRIRSMIATGYTGPSTQFYAHAGSANNSATVSDHVHVRAPNFGGTHVAYWLFGNASAPRYIHCVVEVTAGKFLHWSFGTISKFSAGAWTGGGYNTGMFWPDSVPTGSSWPFSHRPGTANAKAYMRADGLLGAGTPGWKRDFGTVANGLSDTNSFTNWLMAGGLNSFTQRSVLAPIYAKVEQSESGGVQQNMILGVFPDVRMVSLDGRIPGEVLTVGSDDWYVFPVREKPASPATGSSAYSMTGSAPNHHFNLLGLAYKRTGT